MKKYLEFVDISRRGTLQVFIQMNTLSSFQYIFLKSILSFLILTSRNMFMDPNFRTKSNYPYSSENVKLLRCELKSLFNKIPLEGSLIFWKRYGVFDVKRAASNINTSYRSGFKV